MSGVLLWNAPLEAPLQDVFPCQFKVFVPSDLPVYCVRTFVLPFLYPIPRLRPGMAPTLQDRLRGLR